MVRLFLYPYIFCLFLYANPAYALSIMEGFWAGRTSILIEPGADYRAGVSRIVDVELTIASEYGHLKIEPDVIHINADTSCEYYFLHKLGKVENIVLKLGAEEQICGDSPKVELVRKDAETLFFSIKDSRMALSETFPLDLRHGVIPEGVKSVIPENFNIIDIEIGMLREQAERQLAFRKYAYTKDGSVIYKGPGWRQRADVYISGESKIYVIYAAISENNDDFSQEHVIFVARHAVVNPLRKITFTAFSNSISLKYGAKDSGDLSRFYNYDGILFTNAQGMLCEESNRQSVNVNFNRVKKFKGLSQVKPNCGSRADIFASSDSKTGLIKSYEIMLWNNDILIENDWRKVAYQTKNYAKLFLGRLSVDHVDMDL